MRPHAKDYCAMVRKSVETDVRLQSRIPKISLTLKQGSDGQLAIAVGVAEFITYSQKTGFTRINLTGGKTLDVQETTDQIDRLVRIAAAQ